MRNDITTIRADGEDTETVTASALLDRPKPTDEHPGAFFPAQESENFRQRWGTIQGSFVDSPRDSVKLADELVASMVQRVAEIFAAERGRLEADWTRGNEASTEDLRQALRRYRAFFDRLLAV